ncbi:MAG TPA: nucleotide-binding protein [Pyrinomonadaceae bacterium]|jgi:predicted nucleotide-binding protein
MAGTAPKIKLTAPERAWLSAICSKLRSGEPVSARGLRVELRDRLPRDFNPSDIDARLLRDEDQITLLGVGLVDPDNELVGKADRVIQTVGRALRDDINTQQISAEYVSDKIKIPDREVAVIFRELSHLGVFHSSGFNYGHGVDGLGVIKIDGRAFDGYLKFESIGQVLETVVDSDTGAKVAETEFARRLATWKQELTDDVIAHYRAGSREKGRLAFERWKMRFTDFLKEYVPDDAARFEALTSHLGGLVVKRNERPLDEFMRVDGDNCLAFIDELADAVRKGYTTVSAKQGVTADIPPSESRQAEVSRGDDRSSGGATKYAPDPRTVFVVHGRNLAARDSLFRFLRSVGLRPLEWSQAIKETGKASPFIGEILDAAFSIAQAVVVLMTPDDEALLRAPFRAQDDPPYESRPTGQARPNVLFEAGMAMGRNPDRTVIVELGTVRPFSDIAGRHTVRLTNSPAARQELAQRLGTAGCPVELSGRDWHTEGDFNLQGTPVSPQATDHGSQNEVVISTAEKLKIKEADRELLAQLRKALPSNGSIKFIRDFSMGSAAFHRKKLDDLYNFMDDWNDAEHEFLDEELEERRGRLYTLVQEYLELVHHNTFPEAAGDMLAVPTEWRYEDNERYVRVVNQLHGKAGEVVRAHQDLVRTARNKLEH